MKYVELPAVNKEADESSFLFMLHLHPPNSRYFVDTAHKYYTVLTLLDYKIKVENSSCELLENMCL